MTILVVNYIEALQGHPKLYFPDILLSVQHGSEAKETKQSEIMDERTYHMFDSSNDKLIICLTVPITNILAFLTHFIKYITIHYSLHTPHILQFPYTSLTINHNIHILHSLYITLFRHSIICISHLLFTILYIYNTLNTSQIPHTTLSIHYTVYTSHHTLNTLYCLYMTFHSPYFLYSTILLYYYLLFTILSI